jgi:hypothetical protein
VREIEAIKLLRMLRCASEWLGDDNIGTTRRKEYIKLQKESFAKLVDLFCEHNWENMNLGGAVKLFECSICKTRRLEEDLSPTYRLATVPPNTDEQT